MSSIIEKKEVTLSQVVKLPGSGNMCFYYTDSKPSMETLSIYIKTASKYDKVLKTFPKNITNFKMNFQEGGSLLFDTSTRNYLMIVDNEKNEILAIGKKEESTVISLKDSKEYDICKFIEKARKAKYNEVIDTLKEYSCLIKHVAGLLEGLKKEMEQI